MIAGVGHEAKMTNGQSDTWPKNSPGFKWRTRQLIKMQFGNFSAVKPLQWVWAVLCLAIWPGRAREVPTNRVKRGLGGLPPPPTSQWSEMPLWPFVFALVTHTHDRINNFLSWQMLSTENTCENTNVRLRRLLTGVGRSVGLAHILKLQCRYPVYSLFDKSILPGRFHQVLLLKTFKTKIHSISSGNQRISSPTNFELTQVDHFSCNSSQRNNGRY